MEQQTREFRACREAQRTMLDQLSNGVAQFDSNERLVFANRPFLRQFEMPGTAIGDAIPFDRFLSDARDRRRTPEVRDFPSWRSEHVAW